MAWPTDFEAMRGGSGCPMCDDTRSDRTLWGARFRRGAWSDAYLGRGPVRPGYAYVIWRGDRHVTEPTELSEEESAGFWAEVTQAARAIEARYKPLKMNWLSLGNGVPHLHVHLVPRYLEDPNAGGPLEADAFERGQAEPLDDASLEREVAALRDLLE